MRTICVLLVWFAVSGSSFVSCSSGSGAALIDPRRDNRAPRAFDSFTTAILNVPVSGFMQAIDDDGDRLLFRLVTAPRLGSVRIEDSASGAYTYLPGSSGTDHFSFQVDDGLASSNIATVTIEITPATLLSSSDHFCIKEVANARLLTTLAFNQECPQWAAF
ncbi:hypothetical protein BH24PSE2_BH24PSE2_02020 [soil metagenome]